MKKITGASLDGLAKARSAFEARLPLHFERLSWGPDQLRLHQTEQLRRLLSHAIANSRYHAERLFDVSNQVDSFELEDLHRLPVMTKEDMMSHYEDVVTDRRLTKGAVDRFLVEAGEEPSALFDEYIILASGGSSGLRGVFAMNLDSVPDYLAGVLRIGLHRIGGGSVPRGIRLALVAAGSSIHATRATAALADGTIGTVTFAPATLPLSEVVARLEACAPTVLAGYASSLARLAEVQMAGGMSIKPAAILSTSENLTPELAGRIASAFGVPPANSFGSSEGLNGMAPPGDEVFTFATDMALLEFVDEDDKPVTMGTPAHHVLVTNLVNLAQPLIRYRLDDSMTQQPSAPGSGFTRATVNGRADEKLQFGDRIVHAHAIRSALLKVPEISEYQVRCGPGTMLVRAKAARSFNVEQVARSLEAALQERDEPSIDVRVELVSDLERDVLSGKLRRFVSLSEPLFEQQRT